MTYICASMKPVRRFRSANTGSEPSGDATARFRWIRSDQVPGNGKRGKFVEEFTIAVESHDKFFIGDVR